MHTHSLQHLNVRDMQNRVLWLLLLIIPFFLSFVRSTHILQKYISIWKSYSSIQLLVSRIAFKIYLHLWSCCQFQFTWLTPNKWLYFYLPRRMWFSIQYNVRKCNWEKTHEEISIEWQKSQRVKWVVIHMLKINVSWAHGGRSMDFWFEMNCQQFANCSNNIALS